MATLIADTRVGPSARAVIIDHGYSHGAVNTPMATLIAEAIWLLWPVLRLLAMDVPTALWQRLWPR